MIKKINSRAASARAVIFADGTDPHFLFRRGVITGSFKDMGSLSVVTGSFKDMGSVSQEASKTWGHCQ